MSGNENTTARDSLRLPVVLLRRRGVLLLLPVLLGSGVLLLDVDHGRDLLLLLLLILLFRARCRLGRRRWRHGRQRGRPSRGDGSAASAQTVSTLPVTVVVALRVTGPSTGSPEGFWRTGPVRPRLPPTRSCPRPRRPSPRLGGRRPTDCPGQGRPRPRRPQSSRPCRRRRSEGSLVNGLPAPLSSSSSLAAGAVGRGGGLREVESCRTEARH